MCGGLAATRPGPTGVNRAAWAQGSPWRGALLLRGCFIPSCGVWIWAPAALGAARGAQNTVTSRRVQRLLSITGNEVVRRGRRERQTRRERKRLEAATSIFAAPTLCWAGGAVLAFYRSVWPGIGSELLTKSTQSPSSPTITAGEKKANQGRLKIANVRW